MQGYELNELFDRLWEAYPRHLKKGEARKVFKGLKPSEVLLNQMLEALEWQKLTEEWRTSTYIPKLSNWLKQERWEDDKDQYTFSTLVNKKYTKTAMERYEETRKQDK